MSDTPEGVGWWQASDGKWYPPEQRQTSPPSEQEPTAETPTQTGSEPTTTTPAIPAAAPVEPVAQPANGAGPWWKTWWALAIAAVILFAAGLGVGVLVASDDDGDTETVVEGTPTDEPTAAPTETPTEEPTDAPTEAPTPEPTDEPTAAPTETPTEEPTEAPTEEPTQDPTPAAETQEFSGNGEDELTFDPPLEGDPLILSMSHEGPSNFIVEGLDEFGEITGFYANAIDSWSGTVPMNWDPGDSVATLVIDAGGDWVITISDRSEAPEAGTDSGDVYEGNSFEVLRFEVDEDTDIDFDCPDCNVDVVINAYGDDLFENLVAGVGDEGFSDSLEVPEGTEYLEIRPFAELTVPPPDWTLTVG